MLKSIGLIAKVKEFMVLTLRNHIMMGMMRNTTIL